ncbi:hypothetical protein AK812_SmicGene1525 [Symbiodinium microadriaticum]|uniref:Uncharacterized protein n=1 Tax=Symbiodinium microadriaticum TaxID=2951 RepID=A0A1Q9F3Y8_SYMMI|nr:hypothetical protein AK812_SmicGene1525 [Symbiodinium microadriaticum]
MRTRENPVTKILDTCLPSVNDFCVEGVIHQCLRMSNASNLTDLVDDSAMPSRHEVAAKADLLAKRLLCCTGPRSNLPAVSLLPVGGPFDSTVASAAVDARADKPACHGRGMRTLAMRRVNAAFRARGMRRVDKVWDIPMRSDVAQAIISSVQASDEVFSLKEACHTMDYRIELADVQHGRVCCARCLQSKPQTVALAADAGQFYEVVQPHSAVNAARRLLSRCRRVTGHETVTVLRGPRRRAFLGGHIHAEFGSAVVFTFTELFLAFSACMFLTLVAVGTTVFRLKGLPIGGVLSKVATSLVLGEEERVWKWDSGRRRRLGYAAVHSSWDKEVARARYVDDLLWVSGVYCVPCLIRAICHCYSVEFDVASTGSHVEWLDVVLHVETLSWSMKRKTWVLPPPWGAARHFAHSFISGRLSRFDEVGLGLEAWVEACTQVFMGLRDAGWPARVAKAAAYRATAVRNKSQRAYLLAVCARVWGTMQL